MPISPIHRPTPIKIETNDRCLFVGRTNSGKTTLAKMLMLLAMMSIKREGQEFRILDPKHSASFDSLLNFPVDTDYDPKKRQQTIRTKAEPDADQSHFYDGIMADIFRRQNTLVYVDEITLVTPNRPVTPAYGALIRQGRERGIGVWSATQRPFDIPKICFTESEHIFIFQLTDENDRKRVSQFTGDEVKGRIDYVKGHDFLYYNVMTNVCEKKVLNLGARTMDMVS